MTFPLLDLSMILAKRFKREGAGTNGIGGGMNAYVRAHPVRPIIFVVGPAFRDSDRPGIGRIILEQVAASGGVGCIGLASVIGVSAVSLVGLPECSLRHQQFLLSTAGD